MKKLSKITKNKIKVGYYWWIFRIPTFINFSKPFINQLYAGHYQYNNDFTSNHYLHTNYNFHHNHYKGNNYDKYKYNHSWKI